MKKLLLLIFAFLMLPLCFLGCTNEDLITKSSMEANSYRICASFDNSNKTLTAKEEVDFKNKTGKTLDNLKFHLHPNAFSENAKTNVAVSPAQEQKAFPNGKNFGGILVTSAKINDNQIDFSIVDNEKQILSVNLPKTLENGGGITIFLEFSLTLPNINHRFGYGNNTINLGNWYPILCVFGEDDWDTEAYLPYGDPFFSEISNYEVSLSYDENLTLASTGNLIKESVENEIKTSTFRALSVRDFAMVLSNKFDKKSSTVGNTLINYFYYDDENSDDNLKTCVDAVKTFNELFGNYPYKTLNVVKANFLQGGMEYPNLVYISDQVTNDADYKNVIIHEIAHQWWYGVVGNNELSFAWIDEGLAEFSTALFYEFNEGYEFSMSEVIGNALSSYLLFSDVYREVYDDFNTAINRPVSTFNTEMEYTYLTYVKSLLMFDSLKDLIGEKKVLKCMKALYETYAMKEVTPNELLDCFEKVSHRKIKGFMTSWLDGTVVLEEIRN